MVFKSDLAVFESQILSTSRWVLEMGLIGQLGVIRLFPMYSDSDLAVFSAQILSIGRWVLLGVMMDNWA